MLDKMVKSGTFRGRPCLWLCDDYAIEEEDQPIEDILAEVQKYKEALEKVTVEGKNG